MRILALSGSLREQSLNSAVARAAAELAPAGVDVEVFDRLGDVPLYDADLDVPGEEPAGVRDLRERIRAADALLVVTPEYNGSVPGVLKNAIDWASRPNVLTGCFRNKPVAVISASDGMFGAMWAGAELKKVMGLVGARVVDAEFALPKAHLRLAESDPELDEALRDVVALLVAEVQPAAATRAAA
jgi:chromate reductase, NAD(P)H dehydrogenase (quinone)